MATAAAGAPPLRRMDESAGRSRGQPGGHARAGARVRRRGAARGDRAATARSSSSRTSRRCPGSSSAALAMPDIHQGYGFPVGGVAAIEPPDGVVSPGGVGYDINCGVRLLVLPLSGGRARRARRSRSCTSSRARSRRARAGTAELVLDDDRARPGAARGAARARRAAGSAREDDLEHTESERLPAGRRPGRGLRAGARARRRPARHARLGQPLHRAAAGRAGLRRGRGRGVRAARGSGDRADPLRLARARPPGLHRLRAADGRRPAPATASRCPTASSPARRCPRRKARRTSAAMAAAANFAFANRQAMAHARPRGDRRGARPRGRDGDAAGLRRRPQRRQARAARRPRRCCVHRKGATRAFPPGSAEIPAGLPRRRPAGLHPRQHGHGELRPRRRARLDGALVRHDLPRRRAADVAARARASRSAAPSCGGSSRRRGSSCAARRTRASPRRRRSPTRTSSGSSRSSSGRASPAASRASSRSASSRARPGS